MISSKINESSELASVDRSMLTITEGIEDLRSPSKLELLPQEIKALIASHLGARDVGSFQEVSKAFYNPQLMASRFTFRPHAKDIDQLIAQPDEAFQKRQFIKLRDITDSQLLGLIQKGYLNNVRSLDLSRCSQLTDAGVAHLKVLKHLQSLSLSGCTNVTDAGIAWFEGLQLFL